jgi:uncharacterized protein (DUF2141 family)
MSGARSMCGVAAALCLSALASTAQSPRDQRGAPVASGTAQLTGIVVDTSAPPQPLRRVIVTMKSDALPDGRSAISDDDGRFAFDRLPPGRYTLSGTKPAYLPGTYGSTRPGRPGIPLQIAAGQALTGVRLTLARGAAVTGTLRDETGEPASSLQVYAFRVPPPGAPPLLLLTGSGTTDDRGVYRIYGLPPGHYLIASAIRLNNASDILALSAAQIDDVFRDLRQRSGAAVEPAAAPPRAGDIAPGTYAYAPVYYPGAASTAAAERIRLDVGEERAGVDFAVRLTRMATIEGVARAADGSAPTVQFVINPEGLQLQSLIGAIPTFSSQATPTGRTFRYTNVAPGRYRIAVQSTQNGVTFAATDVEVTGTDVTGVTLVLQPALRMTGRVIFDGTTLPPPENLDSVRVQITSTNGLRSSSAGYTRMGNFPVPPATAASDGTFALDGIVPDAYRLTATAPGGWWLRSAVVGGRDVLDHPLEIAGSISGAVLTFSDRQTTLSGRLLGQADQAEPAYFVAVFPADRALWQPGARRIQLARAGTDGTWAVRGLPAGDYLIAALTDVGEEDLLERSFLETLAGAAVRVSIAEGEDQRQDLRIGR